MVSSFRSVKITRFNFSLHSCQEWKDEQKVLVKWSMEGRHVAPLVAKSRRGQSLIGYIRLNLYHLYRLSTEADHISLAHSFQETQNTLTGIRRKEKLFSFKVGSLFSHSIVIVFTYLSKIWISFILFISSRVILSFFRVSYISLYFYSDLPMYL